MNKGKTHFKKGNIPWNKGIKTGLVPKTAFKKNDPRLLGKIHHNWKGDDVGYVGLHYWIRRRLGDAKECAFCKSIKNIQWANKSHKYKRELSDWVQLCRSCHMKFDNIMEKVWITRRRQNI